MTPSSGHLSVRELKKLVQFQSYCDAINGNKGFEANLLHALVNYTFLDELWDAREAEFKRIYEPYAAEDAKPPESVDTFLSQLPLALTYPHASVDMLPLDQLHYGPRLKGPGNSPILRLPGDVDLIALEHGDVAPLDRFAQGFASRYGATQTAHFGAGVPGERYNGKLHIHNLQAAQHIHSVAMTLDITPQMFATLVKKGASHMEEKSINKMLLTWLDNDGRFKQEIVDRMNAAYAGRIKDKPALANSEYTRSLCTRDTLKAVLWVDCKMNAPYPLLEPYDLQGTIMPDFLDFPCGSRRAILPYYENVFADLTRKFLQAATNNGSPESVAENIMDFGLRYHAMVEAFHEARTTLPQGWTEKRVSQFMTVMSALLVPTRSEFHSRPFGHFLSEQDMDQLKAEAPNIEKNFGHKYYMKPDRKQPGDSLEKFYLESLDAYWKMRNWIESYHEIPELRVKKYLEDAKNGQLNREITTELIDLFITRPTLQHLLRYDPDREESRGIQSLTPEEAEFCVGKLQRSIDSAREIANNLRNLPGKSVT